MAIHSASHAVPIKWKLRSKYYARVCTLCSSACQVLIRARTAAVYVRFVGARATHVFQAGVGRSLSGYAQRSCCYETGHPSQVFFDTVSQVQNAGRRNGTSLLFGPILSNLAKLLLKHTARASALKFGRPALRARGRRCNYVIITVGLAVRLP